MAAISARTAANPIPDITIANDDTLLSGTIKTYLRQLDLKNTTPEELELLDKKYAKIIQRLHMRSAKDIALSFSCKTIGVGHSDKKIVCLRIRLSY